MKPLALDFVATPSANRWGVMVLVLGLGLSVALALGYGHLLQERALLEDRLEQLSAVPKRATAQQKPDEKARAMGVVAERISVPWERLFQDVESCDSSDVALLQLQPNITQHQVILTGEARNRNAVEAYMKRLEQTRSLEGVHLAQHNQAPESGP
ncbi:MAG: PilN domain-containing protein, partial [Burkholderiales bacterium]